jgi:hypothetical protein
VLKEWRADVKAGGARRDLAIAKAMVGSGMGALMAEMAADGDITGAPPSDQNKARLLYANGWQPYSFKVGDQYISYQRMDPFSSTIGIAADLATKGEGMTDKQRENAAVMLTTSIMANMANKTWLGGLSDALAALKEPEMNAERFTKRMAGSLAVPTGIAQVARTIDPMQRDADGALDAVKARIPFVSQALPVRRDVWGQPLANQGGVGPDLISPMWLSRDKRDPVTLAALASGATVGKPDQGEMTAGDFARFRERSGILARGALLPAVQSDLFKGLTAEQRKDLIEKTVRSARQAAKKEMGLSDIPPPPPGFTIDPPPAGYIVDQPR